MKKANATVFIIIGLTFLLLASTVFYMRGQNETVSSDITRLSPLATEVTSFVNDCIELAAQTGLTELAAHGGYIDPETGAYNGTIFDFSRKPTEADGVYMAHTSAPVVYWEYLRTPNTCTDCFVASNTTPTVDFMQLQLEAFIKQHGTACVSNLASFSYRGIEVQSGELEPKVQFTKEAVVVETEYPLVLQTPEETVELEAFVSELQIPLLPMLQLAADIHSHQRQEQFLEKTTFAILSRYFGLEHDSLPPVAAITHDDDSPEWNLLAAKSTIRRALQTYIPLVQVNKSLGAFYEEPFNGNLVINGIDTPFDVQFYYLGWPLYVDITPRTGNTLKAESYTQKFPLGLADDFRVNSYEFFYDVSYPVVVEITAGGVDQERGFRFRFAMETNLRDNIDLREWAEGRGTLGPIDYDKIEVEGELLVPIGEECVPKNPGAVAQVIQQIESQQDDERIANAAEFPHICPIDQEEYTSLYSCQVHCTRNEPVTIPKRASKNLFCETNQQVGTKLTVAGRDAVTGDAIDLRVDYRCGDYDQCEYDPSPTNSYALPICYGGQLLLEADGYLPQLQRFDSLGGSAQETYELLPIREMSVSADVLGMQEEVVLQDLSEGNISSVRNLSEHEVVSLTLTLLDDERFPVEQPFVQRIVFANGSQLVANVRLVPGVYEVRSKYLDYQGHTLQRNCMKYCDGFSLEFDAGDVLEDGVSVLTCDFAFEPKQEVKLDPFVAGGLELNNETGYWNLTPTTFAGGTHVHFNLLQLPRPTCIKTIGKASNDVFSKVDLFARLKNVEFCNIGSCIGPEETGNLNKYTKIYRELLEPQVLNR